MAVIFLQRSALDGLQQSLDRCKLPQGRARKPILAMQVPKTHQPRACLSRFQRQAGLEAGRASADRSSLQKNDGHPAGWGVQAIYVSMGRRHDYRSALKEVEAPVLVLHGAKDLQSEAVSRTYADALPNARFKVLDSAHFAFYERPEEFAAVVGGFLGEHR